ncbi:MAG: (Fe-S)-binding protein [Pseudomonadota bacterium]
MNPDFHIQREAAKCVACGLCLPHCPTYNLLHDETESPRGRLSLMMALAKNDLPLSARLESHLSRCLGCRACEKVCPSYVAYGQALDSARALIASRRAAIAGPANRSVSLIQWLVEKPARMRRLGKWLQLYQATGLQWLLRKSHALRLAGLNRLDAAVPKLQTQGTFARIYPATNGPKGRVALFTGCQANLADRQVLTASIRLLNRLGYEVQLPPAQGCCGALHLHDGQTGKAAELMRNNLAAFANADIPIVSVASGCAATLGEYGKYLEEETSKSFSGRIRDISQFLADAVWPENIAFRPLAGRIAVHDPCTMTNVLRQERTIYTLLGKIPGVEIIALPGNNVCCGAAGTYHLTQAAIADRLRAPKIDQLRQLAPDALVSSNSGCATFLAAGLREAGLAMEVMHPVVLLERQLKA